MNETLRSTMDMVREIRRTAQIKGSRYFGDLLADRIVQACTEEALAPALERLSKMLDASVGQMDPGTQAAAVRASFAADAPAVLEWLRKYPRVASMLAMLKREEYEATIVEIAVEAVAADGESAVDAGAYDVTLRARLLSPLAHGGDGKAGNATLFRRMQVLSKSGRILTLPYYSGNAVRGQMRDLLADDLVSALGMKPRRDKPPVALWFFHALYAGGALEENSAAEKALQKMLGGNGAVKAEGIHAFRDTLPGLSLLGCALGNRVLPGRAKFGDLRPACRQWGNGETETAQLFEWLFLTRREDHEEHPVGDHSGMIANTECLRAGVELRGGIDIDTHASELERSALGRGLALLAERGALGAENRRGLGRVAIELEGAPDPGLYVAYLAEAKETILEYLEELGAIHARDQLDLGIAE
jgi:hypothetical protein